MIAPAPQSKPHTAVATSVGANYFRFKVFNYLDKVITLNPQLSIEIKDPADAKPFEEHLRKIAQATDSKNIPVYVTSAGPVETDRVVLPFFKNPKYKNNDYERNPYLPHKSIPEMLAKAGLPADKFKLDFGNDTQMNIKYAIKNFREHLKPGNTLYHFITGQGLNGGSARVTADYNSADYLCREPGHLAMPGVEENLILEGEGRKNRLDPVTKTKAAAEPYCAGGNENDAETGPKATVYNLLKLFNTDKAKFQVAIDLLNKKTSSNITAEIFTASPLFELAKSNKLTTFEIGEKAKAGDAFAQAVLTYTASRLADFMINLVKTEGRISERNPLGLISYSGGLSQCFYDKCPKAWKQLEMRLTEALGPGAKLVLCKPEEGFDGTIELAKFALGEDQANKEAKTPEKQAETKVSFFRTIINWIKSLFGFKA